MNEKARKEEENNQKKEHQVFEFWKPQSRRMNNIRDEVRNPSDYQPQEKFLRKNKFAIVVCNQKFDKARTTKDDLHGIEDDLKMTR